jgi:transketolase
MSSRETHDLMANAIRSLAIDGVEAAKSGHPGLPMGAADVATVLFKVSEIRCREPAWPDRDRFVLSAGHGSMLLYSLLYLTGYEGVMIDRPDQAVPPARLDHCRAPGKLHTPGIETTTGPLGQGIATAVGMALAERMLNAEFGKKLVDHHTYVLASDGDLMEGISQEAIAIAGHLKLSSMIVLWDDNGISIDGPLSISDSVDQVKRFQSAGWRAERVDGHDPVAIGAAIERAQKSSKPTLIACKTVIGFGSPKRAGTSKAHGEPLGTEEAAATKAKLGISGEAFAVDAKALKAWRTAGSRGAEARKEWEARLATLSDGKRAEFERRMSGIRSPKIGKAVAAHKKALLAAPQNVATRKSSELALDAIKAVMPELVSGSADLTPSNNTKAKGFETDVTAKNFKGRYIHWGIREHGMARP